MNEDIKCDNNCDCVCHCHCYDHLGDNKTASIKLFGDILHMLLECEIPAKQQEIIAGQTDFWQREHTPNEGETLLLTYLECSKHNPDTCDLHRLSAIYNTYLCRYLDDLADVNAPE